MGPGDAEAREAAFDSLMESVRREGGEAFRSGVAKEDCPYDGHPEPHMRTSWVGGWAEAALGLDEPFASGPFR